MSIDDLKMVDRNLYSIRWWPQYIVNKVEPVSILFMYKEPDPGDFYFVCERQFSTYSSIALKLNRLRISLVMDD